jgi:GTP-binding protein LepA
VEEVGRFALTRAKKDTLSAGEVGYIIAGVKTVSDVRIGDTITLDDRPVEKALPGFKEIKPVVFSSIYPIASDDYEDLAVALEKYKLTDAALVYTKDSSAALGLGFRCGFLGLLHLEIVQERLERSSTSPSSSPCRASGTASPSRTEASSTWTTPRTTRTPRRSKRPKNPSSGPP